MANKKISELEEVLGLLDNAYFPIIQGNPIDDYKINAQVLVADIEQKIADNNNFIIDPDYLEVKAAAQSAVQSVTSTDNHIIINNDIPNNPTLSFLLVDNENLLTDDELAVVQATSGTNTGDQDLSGLQTKEDALLETESTNIVDAINEVNAIAKGAGNGRVFATVVALDAWLAIPENVSLLKIGDAFYIVELEVPDYWWDGTQKQELETQKVDLSQYYTADEIDTILTDYDSTVNKVKTLTNIGGQLTGFSNPLDVIVTYDGTNRTVTLTGNVDAYWQGIPMTDLVPSFVSGWTSTAHSAADGGYFLYFNGTSFVWDTVAWDFKQLQIAMSYRDGANFCLRECHGLQDWQSHEANHNNIGTVLRSGADLEPNSYTALSTTATNRRPKITSALIYDEDLPSLLAALSAADVTANGYTRMFMSDAATANIEVGQTDIIEYATRFQYNLFTGGVWTKATAANNDYAKIFLMAIPTTADADCAKRRFVWIMPQQVGTLAVVDALTPNNINLGQIAGALAEYVFVQEFVIQATATSWQIVKNAKLTGNKRFQSSTTGNYLSAVATNTTLTGNGTPSSPLGIPYRTVALADGNIDMTANPAEIYTRTASASQQFTILNPVIGKVFYLQMTGGTLNADLFASPMVETWILNALVTDYVPASTNILACQITSVTTMKIFWTE